MGASRKYAWKEWFNQPRTVLVRGVDYELSQSMMYQTIKNSASRLRKRVYVEDTGTGMVIEVLGDIERVFPYSDQTAIIDEPKDSLARDAVLEEKTTTSNSNKHEGQSDSETTASGNDHADRSTQARR